MMPHDLVTNEFDNPNPTSLGPNQQLWVGALRSGEYKQTRGTLQFNNCFCCLGVACKVAEQHSVPIDKRLNSDRIHIIRGGNLFASQPAVKSWLGLKRENECMRLNDSQGQSFPQIADYIEANAHTLFTEPK